MVVKVEGTRVSLPACHKPNILISPLQLILHSDPFTLIHYSLDIFPEGDHTEWMLKSYLHQH
jgi:hypothetical protein